MSSNYEGELDYNSHYLKLCEKYNINPINMNLLLDQSHNKGVHEMMIKWTLSTQFKKMSPQEKINIMKKKIKILWDLINDQTKLDKLYLSQCYFAFSTRGFSKIAKLLSTNNFIKELYLKNNHLKKENIEDIVEIITTNKTITKLDLEENLFGTDIENMKKIGAALIKNKTLKEIVLNHNNITSEGAVEFIKFLKKNKTIKKIDLKYNKFGNSFAKYILGYLPHGSLRELDLFGNNIDSSILKKIEQKLLDINDKNEKNYSENEENMKNDNKKKISTYDNKSNISKISDDSFDINIDSSTDLVSNYKLKNNNDYKNNSFNNNDKKIFSDLSDNENDILSSSEIKRKIDKMKKEDITEKKNEKQSSDFDLSQSETIDEFIRQLSSLVNISIDDFLAFCLNSDRKNKLKENDKILNSRYDFNRDFEDNYIFSDNLYYNNFNKNSINDKTNQYNNYHDGYHYENLEKYNNYNELNNRSNSLYENIKDIDINDIESTEKIYRNSNNENSKKYKNNNENINNDNMRNNNSNNNNNNNNFNSNVSASDINNSSNESINNNKNNNYNDNINYNEKARDQSNTSNEECDSKSNSSSNSDIKPLDNNFYINSSFENQNENIKDEEISEVSSINSEICIPNKILSPELISQITQIMKENEFLKSRIKFYDDNVYLNPDEIVLLNKEHENYIKTIENLKQKLIFFSKENEKLNEEMEYMRRREDSILKQFEDKLCNLDIQYAKKFEDNEYKLENKYIKDIEKYTNNISELEREKILLCKTLKMMENKLKSLKVKSENEKECLINQMKNNIDNKIRIILMKVKEFQKEKNSYESNIELLKKQYSQELSQQENRTNEKEKIIEKLDLELTNKKKKLELLNEKMMSMMNEINNFKVKFKNIEYDMKVEIEKIKDDFRAREVKYQNEISILNDNLNQNQEIIIKLKTDVKRKEDDIKNLHEKQSLRMKELETSIFQCLHKSPKKLTSNSE